RRGRTARTSARSLDAPRGERVTDCGHHLPGGPVRVPAEVAGEVNVHGRYLRGRDAGLGEVRPRRVADEPSLVDRLEQRPVPDGIAGVDDELAVGQATPVHVVAWP